MRWLWRPTTPVLARYSTQSTLVAVAGTTTCRMRHRTTSRSLWAGKSKKEHARERNGHAFLSLFCLEKHLTIRKHHGKMSISSVFEKRFSEEREVLPCRLSSILTPTFPQRGRTAP